MPNLMAYIPVVNRRHLEWLRTHERVRSDLFLIPQGLAEELIPRLARNVGAVDVSLTAAMLRAVDIVSTVGVLALPGHNNAPNLAANAWKEWEMPDEDVSHAFAEKYLVPAGCTVWFERIWARYDMLAVKATEPVIPDVELSTREFDRSIMRRLRGEANNSPDWWRQVAMAVVSSQGEILALQYNQHMPTEYETDVFGDPGINRDAGEKGKSLACHCEIGGIADCARQGLATEGGLIYVTTFPCETCAYAIALAGFSKLFFLDGYSSISASRETLRAFEVKVIRVV